MVAIVIELHELFRLSLENETITVVNYDEQDVLDVFERIANVLNVLAFFDVSDFVG